MKLLVFDIDGTLTDTNAVDTDCFVEAIQNVLGVPEIETDWEQYLHVTDSGLAEEITQRHLGRGITPGELAQFEAEIERRLWNQPADRFTALPGAREFLQDAAKKPDVSLAMATGAWRSSALCKLKRAGLDASAIPLASASDHVQRTEIMELARARALPQTGVKHDVRCCYFGDGTWDLKASAQLGWEFIAIGERHAELSAFGASLALPDYTQAEVIWDWIESRDT